MTWLLYASQPGESFLEHLQPLFVLAPLGDDGGSEVCSCAVGGRLRAGFGRAGVSALQRRTRRRDLDGGELAGKKKKNITRDALRDGCVGFYWMS